MPRYYFDLKNGHRLIDPSGLDCANAKEATKQAKVIAAQIAQDVPSSADRRLAVMDEKRREVAVLTIGDQGDGIKQTGRGQRPQGPGQEAKSTQRPK